VYFIGERADDGVREQGTSATRCTLPLSRSTFYIDMASKGWLNIEAAGGLIPETSFWEGDSAFSALGLTRQQRLYGFIGWCAAAMVLLMRKS
jgi:hypothetical protein